MPFNRHYLTPTIISFLAVIALIIIAISCGGSSSESGKMSDYLHQADKVWGFRGSVLVAQNGKILLSDGYGFADRTANRRNTPETQFLIGSMTKTFTAIAIMQLVERGEIALDDHISKYLPDYPKETADKITIDNLLAHTSGIPDLLAVPGFRRLIGGEITPDQMIDLFKNLQLEFEPGSQSSYSNSGYVLLGKIIEAVSGQDYYEFIKDNITAPLGMDHTGYYPDYSELTDFAVGYFRKPDETLSEAPVIHPSAGYSAGGLASTTDDLYLLCKALYDTTLLPQSAVTTMITPHADHYGYGWLIDTLGGHLLTEHGGGTPGFSSIFQRWVDDSLCVIILSNVSGMPVNTMAISLAAIVFGEPYEPPVNKQPITVDPGQLEQYIGLYKLGPNDFRTIGIHNDRLYSERNDGPKAPLIPEAPDKFYFANDQMVTITFLRDKDGLIDAQVFRRVFDIDTARRVDLSTPDTLR